jgi:hypothetical protein
VECGVRNEKAEVESRETYLERRHSTEELEIVVRAQPERYEERQLRAVSTSLVAARVVVLLAK